MPDAMKSPSNLCVMPIKVNSQVLGLLNSGKKPSVSIKFSKDSGNVRLLPAFFFSTKKKSHGKL
jgi:hypothetical protein